MTQAYNKSDEAGNRLIFGERRKSQRNVQETNERHQHAETDYKGNAKQQRANHEFTHVLTVSIKREPPTAAVRPGNPEILIYNIRVQRRTGHYNAEMFRTG